MRAFAALCAELDAESDDDAKVAAIARWLSTAAPDDAAWGVHLLAGGRPRRALSPALLRREAAAMAGVGEWLFDACHQRVGNLAETLALMLPPPAHPIERGLAEWLRQHLLPLRGQPLAVQAGQLRDWLAGLQPPERCLMLELVGGGLRIGASRSQLERALARHAGLATALAAQRLADWLASKAPPGAERLAQLLAPPTTAAGDAGQPYPVMALPELPGWTDDALGELGGWCVDWHFDGLRAQAVRRAGRCWIWADGDQLVTDRFPDVVEALAELPDGTVLDGQLVVWRGERPGRLDELQPRLQRKALAWRLLVEAPVRLVVTDLLELDGCDLRALPLRRRREQLAGLLANMAPMPPALGPSPALAAADWAEVARLRAGSRRRGVVGLSLRRADAACLTPAGAGAGDGAVGPGWVWRADPSTIDGVLVYAQAEAATGRWIDCSFAVWSRAPVDADEAAAAIDSIARRDPARTGALQLVPIARTASGLGDDELVQLDACVRSTVLEKFGPVRSLRPSLVVTLVFDGVARSPRHKSGLTLRAARMLRLRADLPLHEAGTLSQLTPLLETAA